MTAESLKGARPRVWMILSNKGGDNGQLESITSALCWPCERRYVHMLEPFVLEKPRSGATLYHVDLEKSDQLSPPWPDLIITAGRRCENVALWIREQAGQQTKIVLLGKPASRFSNFDLVIKSVEQQVPPLPNVCSISLPLMRVNAAAVATAVTLWRPRLAGLPRPLIGVFVGGPTASFLYNDTMVKRLLRVTEKLCVDYSGTPYVVTSRRTPPSVVDALQKQLPKSAQLFRWQDGAKDNPYLALLGSADSFMVTADSISMMVEIVRLAKPLAILDLPIGWLGLLDQLRRSLTRVLYAPTNSASVIGSLRHQLSLELYRHGILGYTRDFRVFQHFLVESGLAVPVGRPFQQPSQAVPDDLPRVASRIEALGPRKK